MAISQSLMRYSLKRRESKTERNETKDARHQARKVLQSLGARQAGASCCCKYLVRQRRLSTPSGGVHISAFFCLCPARLSASRATPSQSLRPLLLACFPALVPSLHGIFASFDTRTYWSRYMSVGTGAVYVSSASGRTAKRNKVRGWRTSAWGSSRISCSWMHDGMCRVCRTIMDDVAYIIETIGSQLEGKPSSRTTHFSIPMLRTAVRGTLQLRQLSLFWNQSLY